MFYLAINRVQSGPFSEADIRQRIARGEVGTDALCWQEGWPQWRKVGEIFPGAEPPVLPSAPPPLPSTPTVGAFPSAGAPTASATPPPTSGLAIASLICGIGVFLCFISAPVAVICGHMAKSKIKQSAGKLAGDGLATAGLLLGYIGGVLSLGLLVAMAVPAFLAVRQSAQDTSVRNNLIQVWGAAEQHLLESGKDMVSYDELIAGEQHLPELQPLAGENYHEIVVRRGDESISVVLGNGRTVSYYSGNPAGGAVAVPLEETDPELEAEVPAEEPAETPVEPEPANEPEAFGPRPAFA